MDKARTVTSSKHFQSQSEEIARHGAVLMYVAWHGVRLEVDGSVIIISKCG